MQKFIKDNQFDNRLIYRSLFAALIVFSLSLYPAVKESAFAETALQEARVIAVNDGDTVTIRMNGKEYRTRLIGIDAPEMGQEPWGERARARLRKMLKDVQWKVSVEVGLEQFDKYNRLLVYLWSENTLINEQMLLDGYSVLFTMQPNSKYVDRFRKAQRSAREKKLGIWGPDGLRERPLDYKKKHPRVEKFPFSR